MSSEDEERRLLEAVTKLKAVVEGQKAFITGATARLEEIPLVRDAVNRMETQLREVERTLHKGIGDHPGIVHEVRMVREEISQIKRRIASIEDSLQDAQKEELDRLRKAKWAFWSGLGGSLVGVAALVTALAAMLGGGS